MIELKEKIEEDEEPTAHGGDPDEINALISVSEAAWDELMDFMSRKVPPTPLARREAAEFMEWLRSTGQTTEK